jgi:hypothetical protein
VYDCPAITQRVRGPRQQAVQGLTHTPASVPVPVPVPAPVRMHVFNREDELRRLRMAELAHARLHLLAAGGGGGEGGSGVPRCVLL